MSIFNILNVDADYYAESGIQSANLVYETLTELNLKAICFDGRTITVLNSSEISKKYLRSVFSNKNFIGFYPVVETARTDYFDIQIGLKQNITAERKPRKYLNIGAKGQLTGYENSYKKSTIAPIWSKNKKKMSKIINIPHVPVIDIENLYLVHDLPHGKCSIQISLDELKKSNKSSLNLNSQRPKPSIPQDRISELEDSFRGIEIKSEILDEDLYNLPN